MLRLPFTTEEFFEVFSEYNGTIWPAHVIAYLLGLLAIALAIRERRFSAKAINIILAASWLWMGIVYHISYFGRINNAAYLFGALFVVQGILFLFSGLTRLRSRFTFRRDVYGYAGAILIVYAMVIYSLLGAMQGHIYPAAPMFGVAPCPTAIFTFGLLLWSEGRVPGRLLIIPGMWARVGFAAALNLGVLEDVGLLIAAVVGIGLVIHRDATAKVAVAV